MADTTINLPNNWIPRPGQREVFDAFRAGKRRAVLLWGRRAGKDDLALHYTACASQQRIGNYWHMLPKSNQCRKAIWDAINPRTGKKRIDEAFPLEIRTPDGTRQQDMMIKFKNGSTWQLVGSDNFDALVGSPPVGLTFSEYALADPQAWGVLRPIVKENGGYAIFISTPRGKNHFYDLYNMAKENPNWFTSKITSQESGAFTAEQLAEEMLELIAERGEDDGKTLFAQEYLCSFDVAVAGSFYGSIIDKLEKEGHITNVPYDPMLPVITSWDLGMKDPTNVWFYQVFGQEIRVIDCYATTGEGVDAYARMLTERKYNYEQHIMPHDIKVREIGTNGKTRYEILQALGVFPMTICRNIPVYDGINAVRMTLPRMYFDKKKCASGLAALRYYHKEYDEVMKRYRDNPEKDWSNHYADSMRYFCVGYQKPMKKRPVSEIMAQHRVVGAW